jgi:hypothetical protein
MEDSVSFPVVAPRGKIATNGGVDKSTDLSLIICVLPSSISTRIAKG